MYILFPVVSILCWPRSGGEGRDALQAAEVTL
jgi:hypothetical protein